MSRVAGIATVCSAAICGGAVCAQPAAAEHPLGRTMARAARALVAIVRADARRVARSEQTGAVVSKRCCHTVALVDVFYRSRPWGYLPWFGAYELTLTSTRRFLGAVSISYFPTPPTWQYGAPAQRDGPTYGFTITGPGRHRGWSFSAMDSFLGCGETSSPSPSIGVCEGSSQAIGFDESRGSAREFARLFRQAIFVARKARRHEPISAENLFPSAAGGH